MSEPGASRSTTSHASAIEPDEIVEPRQVEPRQVEPRQLDPRQVAPRQVVTREAEPKVALPAARDAAASYLERLLADPSRFDFDAAIALLMRASGRGDPGDAIRFKAALGLAFVPSDVDAVERSPDGFTVETGALGLTGPSGVLPRPYTEMVNDEHRHRSHALSAFLDLLAQRPIAQFAAAGMKYRPHRAADAAAIVGAEEARPPQDGMREILLALIGYSDPGLQARLETGVEPLLYYSGAFAARPRSADRLAAILSDWLGQKVEIEQFAGAWAALGRDQQTSLPKGGKAQFNQLGVNAASGAMVWDIRSRITLHIGPLEHDQFQALLPGGVLLQRIVAFTRAYLGLEIGFAVNPILAAHAVPVPALGPSSPSLLGWTGWLPVSAGRKSDATEAKFSDNHLRG